MKIAGSVFHDAIVYGLSALTCSHPTLEEERLLSVKAVYEGKGVFAWLPMGFGSRNCYQTPQFVFDHKLGPIGFGMNSTVLVNFRMVSLMVAQVRKL